MMSKRKLRSTTSSGFIKLDQMNIMNFISYSDGKNDLKKISELINLPLNKVKKIYNFLLKKKLIKEL